MESIINKTTGDIDIPVLVKKTQEYVEAKDDQAKWAEAVIGLAQSRGVDAQTFIQQMKDYAVSLRKKYPHWKPAKLQRKVAEYFKLDLV